MHTDKISNIETSMTDMDGRVGELETCYAALQDENSKLYAKLGSLENFSRRNNLKVTGLEEKKPPHCFYGKVPDRGFWRGQFHPPA